MNVYFSLITPAEGHTRRAAHERAKGALADHQWIWGLFPSSSGAQRDFLFRRSEADGLPRFYVVSHRAPTQTSQAWQVQTRSYEPKLARGDRLQFELRANPTVRHARNGGSKRHDIVMEAKKRLLSERGLSRWGDLSAAERPALYELVWQRCGQWLARCGDQLGFVVDEGQLRVEAYQQHGHDTGRMLRFSTVDFSGALMVSDPEVFVARALYRGIGHAKAFGCGLMLVRRV